MSWLFSRALVAEYLEGTCSDAAPRVANGVAARMDRLKAIGNGQVPGCAVAAWRILTADDQ